MLVPSWLIVVWIGDNGYVKTLYVSSAGYGSEPAAAQGRTGVRGPTTLWDSAPPPAPGLRP